MNYSIDKNRFLDNPIVDFDKKNGLITISGRFIQMNADQFWESMKKHLKEYVKTSEIKTSIRFQMEYINSSSIQQLLDFLKLLNVLMKDERKLNIEWLYEKEDEDMLELGNCIHNILQLPMRYIQMN